MARYHLENRYQDSGWERLSRESFDFRDEAIARAAELSLDSICYGMVRVVDDGDRGRVVETFSAGGRKVARSPWDDMVRNPGFDADGNRIGCGRCDNCSFGCVCLYHGPWCSCPMCDRTRAATVASPAEDVGEQKAPPSMLARLVARFLASLT